MAIAACGSVSAAAQQLFVAQSSISGALKEVEKETGITVFKRSKSGMEPTLEGLELIGMVSQVVQMDDLIASRYGIGREKEEAEQLAVSGQRYSFVTEALAELMEQRRDGAYSFALRETDTQEVIADVRALRSELGVLCLTARNRSVLKREIDRAGLAFEPLAVVPPRLLVREQHPLASCGCVRLEQLAAYPRVVFEQSGGASPFYSEEPLPEAPFRNSVAVRDRSTVMAILNLTDAYTIATGLKSKGMDQGIAVLPLDTDEAMEIGCLVNPRASLSETAEAFLEILRKTAEAAAHPA